MKNLKIKIVITDGEKEAIASLSVDAYKQGKELHGISLLDDTVDYLLGEIQKSKNKVMSKEQQELLDVAYNDYKADIVKSLDINSESPQEAEFFKSGLVLSKQDFIDEVTTDVEFAKRRGVTVYTEVDNDEVWMGIVYNNKAAKVQIR